MSSSIVLSETNVITQAFIVLNYVISVIVIVCEFAINF